MGDILQVLNIQEGRVVVENSLSSIPLVNINIEKEGVKIQFDNKRNVESVNISASNPSFIVEDSIKVDNSAKIDVLTVANEVKDVVNNETVFGDSTKPAVRQETTLITNVIEFATIDDQEFGGSYKLMNNLIINDCIDIGSRQNTTLDFNGYSIDFKGIGKRPFTILKGGILTIKNGLNNSINKGEGGLDSTTRSIIEDQANYGVFGVSGTLNLYGGYFSDVGFEGSTLKVNSGAKVTIYNASLVSNFTNGVINSSGEVIIHNGYFYTEASNRELNGNYYSYTIISSYKITVYNAKVYGIQGGVALNSGEADIYNIDITVNDLNYHKDNRNTAFYALYVAGERGVIKANIYNGSFKSSGYAVTQVGNDQDGGNKEEANAKIYGGVFEALPQVGNIKTKLFNNSPTIGSATLYGGKYFQDVSNSQFGGAYIGEGYEVIFEDPYYVVKKALSSTF